MLWIEYLYNSFRYKMYSVFLDIPFFLYWKCILFSVCFIIGFCWYIHKLLSVASVQFSHSVVSDSLQTHELQHTRPPCPSPTPWVHPNPCPLNQWCHPTISSSAVPLSSCPQLFPASGSFPVSRLFTSGDQSIGASSSASVLPIQDWFPLGLTSLISLLFEGLSKSLLQHHSLKASVIWCSAFFIVQLSHLYMTTGKTIASHVWTSIV